MALVILDMRLKVFKKVLAKNHNRDANVNM